MYFLSHYKTKTRKVLFMKIKKFPFIIAVILDFRQESGHKKIDLGSLSLLELRCKLGRGNITQRTVDSLAIIKKFNVLEHLVLRVLLRFELGAINKLFL